MNPVSNVYAPHGAGAYLGGADTSSPQPQFMVLGPLQVQGAEGAEVSLGPPLHRQVLAALILSADVPRTSSWLARAVWGRQPPGDPASSLRTAVKGLRRQLGASARHLTSPEQGFTYMFTAKGATVDAVLFGDLADRACRAWYGADARNPAEVLAAAGDAAELLAAAAGLWREPALADVPATAALRRDRDKLLRGRDAAEGLWLDARLALGGHHEAVGDIRRALDRNPFQVHAWAQLMLALHRCGRDDEALLAFSKARAVFAEYGTDPGPELAEIRRVIARRHRVAPAARGADAPPG